jgi:small-conductance mechanosensitive channel
VSTLVPNQNLINNPVVNWSYSDPRVRLKLPVRVSYQSDPELAMQLMLQSTAGHPRVITNPGPVARLMSFGDHGIELELRFWIPDPQEGVNNVRSDVNRAIWRLFRQHGIVIPVAQREVKLEMVNPRVGAAGPARDD